MLPKRLAKDLLVDESDESKVDQKGNTELLEWVTTELEALGEEQFFHRA